MSYRGALVRSHNHCFLFRKQRTRRSLDGERCYALSKDIEGTADQGCCYTGTQEVVNIFHRHCVRFFKKCIPMGDSAEIEKWASLTPVLGGDQSSLADIYPLSCLKTNMLSTPSKEIRRLYLVESSRIL